MNNLSRSIVKNIWMVCAASMLMLSFTLQAKSTQLLVNKYVGFNVKGYNYEQKEMPCDIETELVDGLVKQAKASNIAVELTAEKEKIFNSGIPVLAIDINYLVLGSKEHSYGKHSKTPIPSIGLTAGIITSAKEGEYVSSKHSCAQKPLMDYNPAINSVLDMGTYGTTVCTVIKECSDDLSEDIIQWAASELADR